MHIAELGHCGDHHPGQPAPYFCRLGRRSSEQPILQLAERQRRQAGVDRLIDVVVDAHHVIDPALVIGQRPLVQMLHAKLRQDGPRGFALDLGRGGQPSAAVAGLAQVGGAEQSLESDEAKLATSPPQRVGLIRGRRRNCDLVKRGSARAHVAFLLSP
jgi:hypothetical protein